MPNKTKPIALVFSDLHFHDFNQFNENDKRIKVTLGILEILKKKRLPMLFAGDWFHEDQHISNKLFDYSTHLGKMGLNVWGISGNHDMSETNTIDNQSPSLFKSLATMTKGINCIDFELITLTSHPDVCITGIPYLTYNIGFEDYLNKIRKNGKLKKFKKKILLIHTDLHGARETDGRRIDSVQNLDKDLYKLFKGFDLVLCGHIHKPQRIRPSIIMVGSPNQQKKSDMGGKFGYWEIYEDMTTKFKKLTTPEFKFYDPTKDTINDYHYWVPINKMEDSDESEIPRRFTNNISRKKLAKRYCEEKGINDKKKIKALKQILDD